MTKHTQHIVLKLSLLLFVCNFLGFSIIFFMGFPASPAVKESTCHAEDPSSIPGSGRFTGEGIGYPLQYSWASLVAQLVKNPPAMWETWVWSLGREDPLEKRKAPFSSIHSGLENSMDCLVPGVAKSRTWLSDFHFHTSSNYLHSNLFLLLLYKQL